MTRRFATDLDWREVDPARWPFLRDAASQQADRAAALEALVATTPDARGRTDAAAVLDVTHRFVARHGAWACGWSFSGGEGGGGGVVRSWCCPAHSMRCPAAQTADKAVRALGEWREWIERLAALFDELAPRAPDVEGSLAFALTRLIDVVAAETGAEDAWYDHAHQVLAWYLERHGLEPAEARSAVGHGLSCTFESWVEPPEEEKKASGLGIAARAVVGIRPAQPDSLARHEQVRGQVDWASAPAVDRSPLGPDGHRIFIDTVDAARDPGRAERLGAALKAARESARQGSLLSFDLLAQLHAVAVPVGSALRTGPAFAKGGAERYGFSEDLRERFERCLDDADDGSVPLLGRAARVYLDVCFFHPFVDGNARAARLAFDLVLAREGVVLRDVRPLFAAPIPAGDRETYSAFLRLLTTLASN